jgi:hypothetical protein
MAKKQTDLDKTRSVFSKLLTRVDLDESDCGDRIYIDLHFDESHFTIEFSPKGEILNIKA